MNKPRGTNVMGKVSLELELGLNGQRQCWMNDRWVSGRSIE